MEENIPTLSRGDEFIVFYRGGANDGQTDRLVATSDRWPDEVTVMSLVDGIETMLIYSDPVARKVGDQVQVTYTWDAEDSDEIEDLGDRNEH